MNITTDWTVEAGVNPNNGLNVRYVVDTPCIQAPRPEIKEPKIYVSLRRQEYNPENGYIDKDTTAGYELIKGKISTDINGNPLPLKDAQGNIVYEEDGVTPKPRNNGYEYIIYMLENGLFTKSVLLNGVAEWAGIEQVY